MFWTNSRTDPELLQESLTVSNWPPSVGVAIHGYSYSVSREEDGHSTGANFLDFLLAVPSEEESSRHGF